MALPPTLNRSLQMTATLTVSELYSEGKSAANDPEEWPLARISERMDGRACKLCRSVHGMTLEVGSPEYREWRKPSHVGCRRVCVYINKAEKRTATFQRPDAMLIERHGHYHIRPKRHAALRVPAEPAGRHFILRNVRNAAGEVERRLDWAPWWDGIPQWKKDLVLEARASNEDAVLKRALGLLGLVDLTDPATMRSAVLLGLKARIEGWIDTAPPKRPYMDYDLAAGGGGGGG